MKQTVSSGLDLISERKDSFQPDLARHEKKCNNVVQPKVLGENHYCTCTNGMVPHIVEIIIVAYKLIKKSDVNTSR